MSVKSMSQTLSYNKSIKVLKAIGTLTKSRKWLSEHRDIVALEVVLVKTDGVPYSG